MSQAIEVKVPDIGDYTDIPVIEVLVKVGDTVEKEQSLVTLESDKATMDVPSSAAGVVKEVKVKVGDNVSEGALIVVLEAADSGAAAAPKAAEKPAEAPAQEKAPAPAASSGGGSVEVKVPDIGDFKDIPVIEVNVKVGDKVEKEQSLVTLESDKATMDVPSPAAGTVKELKVKVGDNVSEGTLILVLEGGEGSAAPRRAPEAGSTEGRSAFGCTGQIRAGSERSAVRTRACPGYSRWRRRHADVEPCIAVCAQICARTGRRCRVCQGHGPQEPHHAS